MRILENNTKHENEIKIYTNKREYLNWMHNTDILSLPSLTEKEPISDSASPLGLYFPLCIAAARVA